MMDTVFVFVMVFTLAVGVWGMVHKPVPRGNKKKKYEGVRDLASWHKNVGTRWNG